LNQILGRDSCEQKNEARHGGHVMVDVLLTSAQFARPLVAVTAVLHARFLGGHKK
jgi:hypothetical protein